MARLQFTKSVTTLSILLSTAVAFAQTAPQTEAFYQKIKEANAHTRGDALALLPDTMKENIILVSNSQSRQMGTSELPRILHFTKTADFILTSSGHSLLEDPAANDLEVLEFDRTNNKWVMATITMTEDEIRPIVYNNKSCLACHGENPRPVWGGYPAWPTTYGGNPIYGTDRMGPEEKVQFDAFVERAKTHEAYKHLKIYPSPVGYGLPSVYPQPNSVFTARLSTLHTNYLYNRIQTSSASTADKYALLAYAFFCPNLEKLDQAVSDKYTAKLATDPAFQAKWFLLPPAIDNLTKLLRFMNVDPTQDFYMTTRPVDTSPVGAYASFRWSGGSDFLGDLVAFRILKNIVPTDEVLLPWFQDDLQTMDYIEKTSFNSTNEEVQQLDNEETKGQYVMTMYPFLRYNLYYSILGSHKLDMCDRFIKKALE